MSEEELIALLRDWNEYDEGKINDAREAAAARIEELEAKLADCEARLMKAVVAMQFWSEAVEPDVDKAISLMASTLAELTKERSDEKGQDDDQV